MELERMVERGFLTREQGEAVRPERLAAFLKSDLGRRMSNAENCRREFKFSLLVPANEYFRDADREEEVLLQGVIDAWFEDEQGITVVDFKSDRIMPGGEVARAEEYRPQLEAYSRALEDILSRPVSHKVLWFFETSAMTEL